MPTKDWERRNKIETTPSSLKYSLCLQMEGYLDQIKVIYNFEMKWIVRLLRMENCSILNLLAHLPFDLQLKTRMIIQTDGRK